MGVMCELKNFHVPHLEDYTQYLCL